MMANVTDATSTLLATQSSSVQTTLLALSAKITWSGVVWSTLQWLVFVVGTVGNLLVVAVLLWRRSQSDIVTQIFVGSLSTAGLALMLSSGWVQGLVFLTDDFPFGKWACKTVYFLQAESIYCHGWNLVVVAADRYVGINKPGHESFVRKEWAIVLVTAIWLLTCGSNIPLFLWSDVSVDKATGRRRCVVAGIDPTARAIQVTFVRVAAYIVPLVITWVCYIGLVVRMKTALTKVTAASTATKSGSIKSNNLKSSPASRKVTIMCIAIAVCFTVTSLPLQIDFFIVAYASTSTAATANNLTTYFRLITMLNACTNPLIYGLMWRPFRQSLFKMAKDWTRCCRWSVVEQVSNSIDGGVPATSSARVNQTRQSSTAP